MELRELQEKVATLQTGNDKLAADNARLSESMALRDAKDMVREVLNAILALPEVTKARLIQSLAKNPPMKDGQLDKAAFATTIQEAVKAEVKYLEKVAGLGQIRGLGESSEGAGGAEGDEEQEATKVEEALKGAFQGIGLSEKAAEIAAKGRK